MAAPTESIYLLWIRQHELLFSFISYNSNSNDKTDPPTQGSPIPPTFTAKQLAPVRMPISMRTSCNWQMTMQLCHQEENQDTLDAVTDLRRNLLEAVELRLWDVFLSRSSAYNELQYSYLWNRPICSHGSASFRLNKH